MASINVSSILIYNKNKEVFFILKHSLIYINLGEIGDFLQNKLNNEGFAVIRINTVSMYISWDEAVVQEQARRDKIKKQMKKQEQSLLKFEEKRNNDLLKSLEAYKI